MGGNAAVSTAGMYVMIYRKKDTEIAAVGGLADCAAKETVLEILMPTKDKPSQYLLPVRSSVLSNKQLLAAAPLYADLGKMLAASTNPRAFRIGAEYRDWLLLNKQLIRNRLFE